MNKKIVISLIGLTSAFCMAGAVGLVSNFSKSNNVTAVKAEAPTNTRRVWIIDNNNSSDPNTGWWTGSTMWAYCWNSNGESEIKVEEEVLSDYYKGLWYFDVNLEEATSGLNVIMRIGNSDGAYNWGTNNQTFTLSLGEFGGEDTIWLNGGVTWDGDKNRNSRNASIGTTNGFSGEQLAVVTSKYDTCSSANTNGYNAYPQFKKNFVDKTAESALSTLVYGQSTYTIQDYVDGMALRYGA